VDQAAEGEGEAMNNDYERRWLCSVHEAAHVQVGLVLFAGRGNARLTAEGGGWAYADYTDDGGPIQYVRHAIHCASGKAAERVLLDDWPPPPVDDGHHEQGVADAAATSLPYPKEMAEEKKRIKGSDDDDIISYIAWRLGVPDECLLAWRQFVKVSAEQFVEAHQFRIVEIATELFRNGRVNIESDIPPSPVASAPTAAQAAQTPHDAAGVE
jgi:hypothetical protein